jgi:GxxExxY protein
VDSAISVHRVLGPGLLESTYQAAWPLELQKRDLKVVLEVPLPVVYEGHKLEVGYRIDLLVEDQVVVEVKAVDCLAPIHAFPARSFVSS